MDEADDDDRLTNMSVFPMTIDDYHMNCIHPDWMNIHPDVVVADEDDPRIVKHQQFVEYHSAIILYNFGITHQCLGMMEHDDTLMMDSEEEQNGMRSNKHVVPSSSTIDASGNHYDDDHHDDRTPALLFASYKILTNTLSWIHELVRPILNEILNEDYTHDDDDTVRHANIEVITTTALDDHYYMNKYLQVMLLINYHVLDIIDTLHFPNNGGGPQYEYHCTMMHEILNFISYLEIFYPMTTTHNNNNIGHGNNTTRGISASPAA